MEPHHRFWDPAGLMCAAEVLEGGKMQHFLICSFDLSRKRHVEIAKEMRLNLLAGAMN